MDEDNAIEKSSKSRPTLRNITNQLGNKRSFSSILGNSSLKSLDKGRENLGSKLVSVDDGDDAKRICVAPRPCKKNSSSNVDVISENSNIPTQNQGSNLCRETNENNGSHGTAIEVVNEKDRIQITNCEDFDPSQSFVNNEDSVSSEGTESDVDVFPEDQGLDNLVMSQSGSVDFGRLPESQESRIKLDPCLGTQTCEDNSGLSASINSIKGCSCTFCTKAAYIWLDLHYQDIKGRISAVKKSQREAGILVERSSRGKGVQMEGPEKSIEGINLESSLMGQWKSLFQHMEHIFQRETDQLEGSSVALTDLKDRCKAELDSCNETHEKS